MSIRNVAETTTHVIAGTTLVGWLVNLLPAIAALVSIVWIGMQMAINWNKFVAAVKGHIQSIKSYFEGNE